VSRERHRAFFPFAVLAAVAAVLTAWLLGSSRIPRGADQAVVALMARHILEGHGHPVFYWGSTYGGTLESHLLVPTFALLGVTPQVFRAFYVVLWAAFLLGAVVFTARLFGRTAALFAAAFLAVPPFFLPYKILTSDGAYASVALLGLGALWLTCEADARLSAGHPVGTTLAALGLVVGLGLWVSPVTLPVSALAIAWVVVRPRPRLCFGPLLTGAAAVALGAAPSLVWNLRHVGGSVTARELTLATGGGLLVNAKGFLSASLPVLLGAARPHFSGDAGLSFPGARAVVPLLILGLLLPALVAARDDRRLRLLIAVPGVLSCAAVLVRRLDTTEPRYLVAAFAALVPLLGFSLARAQAVGGGSRTLAIAGFAVLLASDLSGSVHAHRHLEDTDDAQVTGPLGPLLGELRTRGVTHLWTSYWLSYRVTFESGGEIFAAPIPREDGDRYAPIQEAVRRFSDPAVVLLPLRDDCFRRYLVEQAEPFSESRSGSFAIFYALPAAVRDLVRAAGALPMPSGAYRPSWSAAEIAGRLAPGEEAASRARVTNEGPCTWMNNVRLVAVWAGPRALETAFATPDRRVAPGETAELTFRLRAPETPGDYVLRLDLEQEGMARFSAKGGATLGVRVAVAR
jgi:Ig-like domain from next to BRCA1 gene